MPDFEQIFREGLATRAELADTSPAVTQRVSTPPHRSSRTLPLLAAAAAVVVVIGAVLALRGGSPARDGAPPATDEPPAIADDGWRTEYWHSVQVDVPASWAWGGSPTLNTMGVNADARLLDCSWGAARSADGKDLRDGAAVPYVARPISQSDVCQLIDVGNQPEPTADYVWLDSPLEPGVVPLGDYVQETVEVDDVAITVATDDPLLRSRIVESARLQDGDCPAKWDLPDTTAPEGGAMAVCAYTASDTTPSGDFIGGDLVYATQIDAASAERFVHAWKNAWSTAVADCFLPESPERVVLTTESRQWVVRFGGGCPRIIARDSEEHVLNEDNTGPWAVDGIPIYVVGPYGGKGSVGDFFRGMLG